ncbi:RNA-binding protein RO60-like [Saccostrea echinata]|uniref:RNA-binding protein RO60-like n=1 Tax=Saccostrea echinata TaxID=191078 RepID=UPI002A8235BB|nr:RNA-binding protein RO60-like [Saccostrea echinata]
MATAKEDCDIDAIETEFLGLQVNPKECQGQDIRISPYQIKNKAGGYVYETDLKTQLARFLLLGSSKLFYQTESMDFTSQDFTCISILIHDGFGKKVVEFIKHFSEEGRAYRQESLLFALAVCCKSNDLETKRAGYNALQSVCRIPSHLFLFIDYCKEISEENHSSKGWGRQHRKAVSNWYINFGMEESKLILLAQYLSKYKKRYGWTHRDIIRLAHPKVSETNPALKYLIMVAVKGKRFADSSDFMKNERKKPDFVTSFLAEIIKYFDKVENAKKSKDVNTIVELILRFKLVREHIPTCFLNEKEVWKALIKHMPMTAMMRNLGKMSSLNLFRTKRDSVNEISFEEQIITDKLKNRELICKARIHPYAYFVALSKYNQGLAMNVNLSWPVCPHIADALEEGFYISFINVTPTKKHFLLALDVTSDMHLTAKKCEVDTHSLSALDAAIFMIVLTTRTESFSETILFSDDKYLPISVNSNDTFHDLKQNVCKKISGYKSSTSDVSLPFKYAIERRRLADVFVIFTNSDKSLGSVHPAQAVQFYRESSGKKDARLIVCEMGSSKHSVGDIEDRYTLTVSGFDSNVPKLINDFAQGIIG